MVQAYSARDKIPTVHLSDEQPSPQAILNIPLYSYLPSEMDEVDLRSEIATMVTRILCDIIPIFHELKPNINCHIQHPFVKESSTKSMLVSNLAIKPVF
jgi:hypothetical protein